MAVEFRTGPGARPGTRSMTLLVLTGVNRLLRDRLGLDHDKFFFLLAAASCDESNEAEGQKAFKAVRHICLLSLYTGNRRAKRPTCPTSEVWVTMVQPIDTL